MSSVPDALHGHIPPQHSQHLPNGWPFLYPRREEGHWNILTMTLCVELKWILQPPSERKGHIQVHTRAHYFSLFSPNSNKISSTKVIKEKLLAPLKCYFVVLLQ